MRTKRLLFLYLMAVVLTFFSAWTAVAQSEYVYPTGTPIRPPYRAIMDTDLPAQVWGGVLTENAQAWTNSRFRGKGFMWRQHHFACQTGDTIFSPAIELEPGEYTIRIRMNLTRSPYNRKSDVTYPVYHDNIYEARVRCGREDKAIDKNAELGSITIDSDVNRYAFRYDEGTMYDYHRWMRLRHFRKAQEFTFNVQQPGTYFLSFEVLSGYDNQQDSLYTSLPYITISRRSPQGLEYVSIGRVSDDATETTENTRGMGFDQGSELSLAAYPKGLLSGLQKGDTICSVAIYTKYGVQLIEYLRLYKDMDLHFYNVNVVPDGSNGSTYNWMRNCTDSIYFTHDASRPSHDFYNYYQSTEPWNTKLIPAGYVHHTFEIEGQIDGSEWPTSGTWDYYLYETPLDIPFVFQGPALGVATKRFENNVTGVGTFGMWLTYKQRYDRYFKGTSELPSDGYSPRTLFSNSWTGYEGESVLNGKNATIGIPSYSNSMPNVPLILLGIKRCHHAEKFKVSGRAFDKNTDMPLRFTKLQVEYISGDVFYGTTDVNGYFQIEAEGMRDDYILRNSENGAIVTTFTFEGHDVELGNVGLTSSIDNVETNNWNDTNSGNAIYDLQGRKLAPEKGKAGQGVYIINGRKVIIGGH